MMKNYRKKPVEIQAWQLTRDNVYEVAKWCGGRVIQHTKPGDPTDMYIGLDIPTLEGVMRAETFATEGWDGHKYNGGDFVIRGVDGEFYSCKYSIFWKTYEEA